MVPTFADAVAATFRACCVSVLITGVDIRRTNALVGVSGAAHTYSLNDVKAVLRARDVWYSSSGLVTSLDRKTRDTQIHQRRIGLSLFQTLAWPSVTSYPGSHTYGKTAL